MTYSPLLIVHIAGGILGFLSGSLALVARKGSPLHRRSGDVFVVAMLSSAASGAYLAFARAQPFNVLAGVFTFYLVATAWLTVLRKANEVGLLLLGLAAGAAGLILGWQAAHRAAGLGVGVLYFIFASIALLASAGDLRMHFRGGVSGTRRLVRHLWRMGFALFIATGSFFLGTPSDPVLRRSGLRATLFTDAIRRTHLPAVPVLFVALLTIFWVFRVRFANAYKTKPAARGPGDAVVGRGAGA